MVFRWSCDLALSTGTRFPIPLDQILTETDAPFDRDGKKLSMAIRLDISCKCGDDCRVIFPKPLRRRAVEIDVSAG